ncbi:MAG: TIGR01212 family radical SAM protein [Acidobacteriota bacterium]
MPGDPLSASPPDDARLPCLHPVHVPPFRPAAGDPIHWASKDLRALFKGRVTKACLDAGATCPNRDGTVGRGGCAWCDPGGSGPDDLRPGEPWEARLERLAAAALHRGERGVVAYFQAFTATHLRPVALEDLLARAVSAPGVAAVALGARPDTLADPVLDVLSFFARRFPLWLEVGMQTSKDATLAAMNRGHAHAATARAAAELRRRGLAFVLHLVFGLPGEDREDALRSVEEAVRLGPWGIKIHPLHLVEGSPLSLWWREGGLPLLGRVTYVGWVCDALERLPPEVSIHRLTGERPEGVLLAPDWCRDKRGVLNAVRAELSRRRSWQGKALGASG